MTGPPPMAALILSLPVNIRATQLLVSLHQVVPRLPTPQHKPPATPLLSRRLLPSLQHQPLSGLRDLPPALSLLHIQLSNQPVGLLSLPMAMRQLLVFPLLIPLVGLQVTPTVVGYQGLELLRLTVTPGSRGLLEASKAILNSSADIFMT